MPSTARLAPYVLTRPLISIIGENRFRVDRVSTSVGYAIEGNRRKRIQLWLVIRKIKTPEEDYSLVRKRSVRVRNRRRSERFFRNDKERGERRVGGRIATPTQNQSALWRGAGQRTERDVGRQVT